MEGEEASPPIGSSPKGRGRRWQTGKIRKENKPNVSSFLE
jgi:hypothetical protein